MSEKKISNLFGILKKHRRNADPGGTGSSTRSHSPLPEDSAAHAKTKSGAPNIRGAEVEGRRGGAPSRSPITDGHANIVGGRSGAHSIPDAASIVPSPLSQGSAQLSESAQPGDPASSALTPTQNPAGPVVEKPITHSIFHTDSAQISEHAHLGAEVASTRSWRERLRDGAIIVTDFVSIIADATEITKPLKVACDGLNYILKNTRVRTLV
jgi:hypothetical protein